MPIFEYSCAPCRHHWEVIVAHSAEDAPGCPQCGRPGKKELSAPAFQFKGSGWYATDYAKAGGKPAEKNADAKGDTPAPACATPAPGCGGDGCATN